MRHRMPFAATAPRGMTPTIGDHRVRSGRPLSAPPFTRPMWYQLTNTDSTGDPVTRRFKNSLTDGFVDVTSNGKCQLPRDVGDQLVDAGFPIEPVSDADGASGGADASDDGDEGQPTDDHDETD